MFNLFIEGGPWFMAILTLLLVAIFFAAWKAPSWVKEIGRFALAFGVLSLALGLRQMFGVLKVDGNVPINVIYGGLNVALIPLIYGVIIYLVSLIVRLIQKPRI
jgi:hypothetical protein